MASNILNVLENVEKGRQNCIKNAKLANLPATDNMDIFNIGNLFLEQNNTEFINPNNPEVGGGWQRPNDWWDTETILKNAQDIEKDEITYHPTYIMLLPNTDVSTTMSKAASGNASQGDAFIFSDEPDTLYVGNQTHTWDVSKDKPCSLGYKTRYVIVYMINAELNASIDFKSNVKVMEMIVDKLTVPTSSSKQIIIYSNKYILNFKCTENTNISTISSSAFSSCDSLTSINLPLLTTISGSSAFSSCYSLTSINLPTLTTISGYNAFYGCYSLTSINLPLLTTISGSSAFSSCSSLTSINLPALTRISGSAFSNCNSLTSINLPLLTTINGGAFSNCDSLTSINLPLLTTINGNNVFSNCYSLTSINLPALTTISSSSSVFSSCYSLTSINLPALTTISNCSAFSSCSSLISFLFYNTFSTLTKSQQFTECVNLKDLQLVTNWRWSLNVKDTDLTHECIIDMFNKLKDLTGEDSLTLTIGANNLAKVTDEEKLIATNKNWILA